MINVSKINGKIDLPEYTQHWTNSDKCTEDRLVIKTQCEYNQDDEHAGYYVAFSDKDSCGYNHEWRNVSKEDVIKMIKQFLGSSVVEVASPCFNQWINQANRECEVIKVTPTRCRIAYEMPNSGYTEAWRHQVTLGKYHYVSGW